MIIEDDICNVNDIVLLFTELDMEYERIKVENLV